MRCKPTQKMAANAKLGLELRERFGRGGTAVGVERARGLAGREGLGPADIKSMYSYFARHEVDKQATRRRWGSKSDPSAGYIAWLLWAGRGGQALGHAATQEAVGLTSREAVMSQFRRRSARAWDMGRAYDQRSLIDSLGALPIAMVLSNPRRPDNPIEVANPAFCDLTGYAESEVVGRNCRFLAGRATDAKASGVLGSSIRSCQPVLVDILNYRKDGNPFATG